MGERRGVGVLAALAPVTMLVVDPAGWFPFGPVKWLAVSTLLPLGGALVLARAPVRWPPRPLGLAMAALLGWLALAARSASIRCTRGSARPNATSAC